MTDLYDTVKIVRVANGWIVTARNGSHCQNEDNVFHTFTEVVEFIREYYKLEEKNEI